MVSCHWSVSPKSRQWTPKGPQYLAQSRRPKGVHPKREENGWVSAVNRYRGCWGRVSFHRRCWQWEQEAKWKGWLGTTLNLVLEGKCQSFHFQWKTRAPPNAWCREQEEISTTLGNWKGWEYRGKCNLLTRTNYHWYASYLLIAQLVGLHYWGSDPNMLVLSWSACCSFMRSSPQPSLSLSSSLSPPLHTCTQIKAHIYIHTHICIHIDVYIHTHQLTNSHTHLSLVGSRSPLPWHSCLVCSVLSVPFQFIFEERLSKHYFPSCKQRGAKTCILYNTGKESLLLREYILVNIGIPSFTAHFPELHRCTSLQIEGTILHQQKDYESLYCDTHFIVTLTLLCGDLEPNPQYLWGMPICT